MCAPMCVVLEAPAYCIVWLVGEKGYWSAMMGRALIPSGSEQCFRLLEHNRPPSLSLHDAAVRLLPDQILTLLSMRKRLARNQLRPPPRLRPRSTQAPPLLPRPPSRAR